MSLVLTVRGVETSPSEGLGEGIAIASSDSVPLAAAIEPGRMGTTSFDPWILRTADNTPATAFANFLSAFSMPWGRPSPESIKSAIAWIESCIRAPLGTSFGIGGPKGPLGKRSKARLRKVDLVRVL